jgi:SpoVK/Ycf46/Vps4 family AAA+-type ATPase
MPEDIDVKKGNEEQVCGKIADKSPCYFKWNCKHCFAYKNRVLQKKGEKSTKDLMVELDKMIGLEKVKTKAHRVVDLQSWHEMRKAEGFEGSSVMSHHMAFFGNPGTGKTVVARMLGKVLLQLGAVERSEESPEMPFIEVSRAELVGQHLGKTADLVKSRVREAFGGVLFVDEAYSLVKDRRDTFGLEAVDTLIKEMEDHRGKVIVILAGYRRPMEKLIATNPGFQSRIAHQFQFDDYTCPQLLEISEKFMAAKRQTPPCAAGGEGSEGCLLLKKSSRLRRSAATSMRHRGTARTRRTPASG